MLDRLFSVETLWVLMLILYVPACIGLIVIVLLQKGKGSGFAGAFGMGGGSDTVFGPSGGKSLPQRMTHVMAAIFMVLALCMSLVSGKIGKGVAPEQVEVGAEMGNYGAGGTVQDLLQEDAGGAPAAAPVPAPEAVEAAESTESAPEAAAEAMPEAAEATEGTPEVESDAAPEAAESN